MYKEIAIDEIDGFKIGHASDRQGATGCTVILAEKGCVAGVDIRGGGPATRETDLLKADKTVEKIHAVVLTGGSAYGLDSCSGVMRYLEEKHIGFDVALGVVPIVCGAALFDLAVGDFSARPTAQMGYQACQHANDGPLQNGNYGAGTGASVGKIMGMDYATKTGIGTFAVQIGDVKIGAIVAVNALGDIYDSVTGERLAGLNCQSLPNIENSMDIVRAGLERDSKPFQGNTTIGCIISNGALTKAQANRLAAITHNAYAQSIRPVHTSFDGDSIFSMSSGEQPVNADALSAIAVEVMAHAIKNAVQSSTAAYGLATFKSRQD